MGSHHHPILFVSHKANKSGAPALLLEIVKYMKLECNCPITVLCMEEGELVNEFKAICTTYVWPSKPKKADLFFGGGIMRGYKSVLQKTKAAHILWQLKNTELVFYNTIVNGHIQKKLKFLRSYNICYVHELAAAIHMLTNKETLQIAVDNTSLFLCVSEAVQFNLINKYQVPANKTMVVSSPVSINEQNKEEHFPFVQQFKSNNKTGNAILIGVMGGNEWRKGFDIFVPLVTLYFKLFPTDDVYFIWKGIKLDSHTTFFDLFDHEKSDYKNKMLLLPHANDAMNMMACFDIHLLLSREDPYPLVVLEAASYAIPTVCFENSGGSQEFIKDDAGIVVPYQDLYTMAHQLHLLVQDPILRAKMGKQAQMRVKQQHDKATALHHIKNIILQNREHLKYP